MAIPALAREFAIPMDPHDRIEYQADLESILESGETISSYTLTMGVEGTALGAFIGSGDYAPAIVNGRSIKFWLEVATLDQNQPPYFDGVRVPIEVSVVTSNVPPRRWQRTVVVRIQQQ